MNCAVVVTIKKILVPGLLSSKYEPFIDNKTMLVVVLEGQIVVLGHLEPFSMRFISIP